MSCTKEKFNSKKSPKIGEIYMMRFDGDFSEQRGWRPGIVFQNNVGNEFGSSIIAIPLTTSIKKLGMPTHVVIPMSEVRGLRYDSMALCENPQRMAKEKIGEYIGHLQDSMMAKIATANLLATSAISFIDFSTLAAVWKKASELNAR